MFLLHEKIFATYKNSPIGAGAGAFATGYAAKKLGLGWFPTISLALAGGLVGSAIEFKITHPNFEQELNNSLASEQ